MTVGGSLQWMVDGYLSCAMWSSTDDDDRPLDDDYMPIALAAETVEQAIDVCASFLFSNSAKLKFYAKNLDVVVPQPMAQAGYDLWLTRNHHGVGFWDRGLGRIGEELTAAAEGLGECNLYVGPGDELYFM